MVLDSAGQIINDAAQELGLPPATFSSALADPTGYQMLGLLNSLGEELTRVHDWQQLLKTMEFTGDGADTQFPLPPDFGRQINQTQWDRSNTRPMQGPDSPQVWGWTQYGLVSVGVFFRYRIAGNQYEVFPVPAVGQQFALYYVSKNWVQDGNDPAIYKTKVTLSSDVPQFDRRMLICGLKSKLWAQKGFETTALQAEFRAIMDMEKAQSQGAPMISLSGSDYRYLISELNVPDGSYYGN